MASSSIRLSIPKPEGRICFKNPRYAFFHSKYQIRPFCLFSESSYTCRYEKMNKGLDPFRFQIRPLALGYTQTAISSVLLILKQLQKRLKGLASQNKCFLFNLAPDIEADSSHSNFLLFQKHQFYKSSVRYQLILLLNNRCNAIANTIYTIMKQCRVWQTDCCSQIYHQELIAKINM